jgi:hypothetical protein
MTDDEYGRWCDMWTDGEAFAESEDAQAEWDAFHALDAAERRGDDGPFADSDAWIAEHYSIDDDGPGYEYED